MSQTIEMIDPVTGEIINEQQLAEQLLKQAKEQGVDLVGPDGMRFCEAIAKQVAEWARGEGLVGTAGYSCVGAVVGVRDRETAIKLRALLPQSIFLVPGYGAQGAGAADVGACFRSDGTGAIVTASRSIIYAYEDTKYLEMYASEWEKCVEHACKDFVAELARVVPVT